MDALKAKYRGLGLLYFEVEADDGEKLILCGDSKQDSHKWLERLRNARRIVSALSSPGRVVPSIKAPTLPNSPPTTKLGRTSGTGNIGGSGTSVIQVAPRSPRDSTAMSGSRDALPVTPNRSPRESTSSGVAGVATPKSPRFSLFGGSPRQPRVKSVNLTPEPKSVPVSVGGERYGWMTKKSKERWFLLRDHVLYWFTKEMPLDTDFRKEVRNFVSVEGCAVSPMQQDSFTITGPGGVSYLLVCRSVRERDDWLRSIETSIKEADRMVKVDAKKSGWLEKKKQRRWFVLNDLILAWFVKEGDVRERGQLNLADCSCVEDDSKTFTLVNVKDDQIRYQLVAKTAEEAKDWMAAIRRACQRAQEKEADILKARATARQNAESRKGGQVVLEKKGWFVKKRKRRFYVLRNTVLMWFVNETDIGNNATMKGSLQLTDCVVTARGFDMQIRTKEGVIYTLTAARKQDVDDWVSAIK
jgi:hypothetical protein